MTDHTPPPDEPLPDQSRARIREELLRAAQGDTSARRRWLAPALAAAAVVLVAGLGAWAVQGGGDDRADPAAPGTSSAAPSDPEPSALDPSSTDLPDPEDVGGGLVQQVGTGTCEEELTNVLPGADEAVAFPEDGGTTSFWVKGAKFTLCDRRGGVTTVHRPLPMDAPAGVERLRVSTVLARAGGGFEATRVAGGLVPAGMEEVFDLRYTFPDGHVEPATTVQDDEGRTWWRMLYSYDVGRGNELEQPPITATLSYSGVQKTYSLDWGTDTCAQANHGC